MSNETDKILQALDDREPEKKPTNWELWSALYFAELIFVLLDAGSALGVWYITGYWYYGLIVFFAGVIPLWLYTKQYTRPLNSVTQRKTALLGGIVAISSVIVVAVFIAALNFIAKEGQAILYTEAGLAVSLVLLLATHGFIMARYFFLDEEIIEGQRTNRIIARGDRDVRRIGVARKVADAKRTEVKKREDFERNFSPQVLDRILSIMRDQDEDGIPDYIDPVDNRTGKPFGKQPAYTQQADRPELDRPQNPTQPHRQNQNGQ